MRSAAVLLLALVLAAGCTAPADDHADGEHHGVGPGTYHMRLSGMPTAPMAPGHPFNVTVHAEMAAGQSMMRQGSDHIGAHFWNRTVSDPTSSAGNSTACAHTGGELPGTFAARCTAPMQPGTYHIRAHARVTDNGTTHNWWGDEHVFVVSVA